jgi:predicted alpha/beta superfamily hydrolase
MQHPLALAPFRRRLLPLLAAALLAAAAAPAMALPINAELPEAGEKDGPKLEQRVITSRDGTRQYRLYLSIPRQPPPVTGYPVLFVLDGNAYTQSAVRALARDDTPHEPVLVIGIGYETDDEFDNDSRWFDFTPTLPEQLAPDTPAWQLSPRQGGADRFLQFVQQELKPALYAEFPADQNRQAIFGHSLGGLFVLHTLFRQPDAFQTYLASSPSLWWGNRRLLAAENRFADLPPATRHGVSLLVTVGGEEQPAAARMGRLRQIDNARELVEMLSADPELGPRVGIRILEGENHGSAATAALPFGLRFAFSPATAIR